MFTIHTRKPLISYEDHYFYPCDTDGLCSGALALAANGDSPVFFTNPVSVLADIDEAKGYDRVMVCDIAINLPKAEEMKEKIEALAKGSEVIYIDHHPLPPGFEEPWLFHDDHACASELTFNYFQNELSPDMSRVAHLWRYRRLSRHDARGAGSDLELG